MLGNYLSTSNLHGFNSIQKSGGFGPNGYFVDKNNYSAAQNRLYTTVNLGNTDPTKAILIANFNRVPEIDPLYPAYTYFSQAYIYRRSADPTSPRNEETYWNWARNYTNTSTGELYCLSLNIARVPFGPTAKVYQYNERYEFGYYDIDGIPTYINPVLYPISTTFSTFSFTTVSGIKNLYSENNKFYTGTSRSNAKISLKGGSVVYIYSVAINSKSTPNWSSSKATLDSVANVKPKNPNAPPQAGGPGSVKYEWNELSLNSNIDPKFNDGGFQYSSSFVYFSPSRDVDNFEFDTQWAGNPFHITGIYVVS